MKLNVIELYKSDNIRLPSPGRCIYCADNKAKLRDEHVLPYAIAANTLILESSCCEICQNIIQKYEQEVLKRQLGIFRAQVNAPTRRPKDRPTHTVLQFVEVNEKAEFIRNLGTRTVSIEEAPLAIHLWQSPMPRRLRTPLKPEQEQGQAWSFVDRKSADTLCRKIAEETGAIHVAVRTGTVNRLHYLRSLAKTAHAFAVSQLGVDGFEPFLLDLILCRSADVSEFVGDDPFPAPIEENDGHTVQIFLGEAMGGNEQGLLCARFSLYPMLGSPPHLVVVGKAKVNIGKTLAGEP